MASYYWSSTTYTYDDATGNAWLVDFQGGAVDPYGKSFGYYVRAVHGGQSGPTVIVLSLFTATPKAGKVLMQWSTEAKIDNAGFNLYRSESEDGQYTKINASLITAEGSSTQGASYEFTDNGAEQKDLLLQTGRHRTEWQLDYAWPGECDAEVGIWGGEIIDAT